MWILINFLLAINEVHSVTENETWNHRHPSYLLHRYSIGELPTDSEDCRRPAKCIPIQNNTCMGTKLPYSTTTLDLIPEDTTRDSIEEKLHLLQGLRHIPKCWAVVQPFLCSVFVPKCINDTVDLPSQEMCKLVSGPCRILVNRTLWPNFIKCENTKLFPKLCKNDMREWKFNTTGKCLEPLVPTDNSLAIFEGIEGCGIQCNNPMYTWDETKEIHSMIAWGAGICLAFNSFTIVTFIIDWRSANKYPAVIIFYINCCFMVSCIGWLVQFIPGNRDVIVCRKDGTLRMSEPSGESLACVMVFVSVYYSLIAAMVWFVILTYSWHTSFQAFGKIPERIDKKGAYFHLIAWCLPLVLTVIIMAMGEIDGNSVTGICFVGYVNHAVRAWFLLAPVLLIILVGGYFLTRGLITLIRLKISSQEIISKKASAKIRETIIRMGLFSLFTFAAVVVTFYCHVYEFRHSWQWKENFRNYIICKITTSYSNTSECKMESKPSGTKMQLHLLAPFLTGILMSSWIWTGATVETWIRFLKRTSNCETEEPIRYKKHKVIAQAFAQRNKYNSGNRFSISYHYKDPVGMNFSDSGASGDVSSTWAAALPNLVKRRGAIVATTGSISSNRRNSIDSEMSFSERHVSVEYSVRRNSLDSQLSVQIADYQVKRKVAGTLPGHSRNRRGKRRREFGKSRKIGPVIRRGSTTSQESQLGAQILSALSIGGTSKIPPIQVPNMKRRSASAGLDEQILNHKMLPFFSPNQSGSDENEFNKNVETGTNNKEDQDTDSEESIQSNEEERKMLDPKESHERCRSKTSNKSNYYSQNETILKHLNSNEKAAIEELTSSLNSCCPELTRLMQSDVQSHAREIATQTSLALDILEMEELKQSIDEIRNRRQSTNCSSKGTQISPQLNKSKNLCK